MANFISSESQEPVKLDDWPQGKNAPESTKRFKAETELLLAAADGDRHASVRIQNYLRSDNQDLRLIMLAAAHAASAPQVWRYLLDCLVQENISETEAQVIAEAYVLDEGDEEKTIKEAILQEAFHQLPGIDEAGKRKRQAAAYLLALRGDSSVIPVLEEIILGDEPRDQHGRPTGKPVRHTQSRSPSDELTWKLRAVQALAALHDERCGSALVKALTVGQYTTDQQLHQAARRALGELGSLAEAAWLETLDHPDSHMRWHAARGLGQIGNPLAVEILAEGLYDDNNAVRWATAQVLANLDSTALPAVLNVLCQRQLNEPFRQAAYHALHAMPSHLTQAYIAPLLKALSSPATSIEAPAIAQRMLSEWKERAKINHKGGEP